MVNLSSVHISIRQRDAVAVMRVVERFYPNIDRLQLMFVYL
jgi:hypothetical protein